ncbi:MAG: hypothetical protein QF718_08420 [Phycisphaerales bacterium]|nr:hypothetical protein [Phycisphaerales bacterium]
MKCKLYFSLLLFLSSCSSGVSFSRHSSLEVHSMGLNRVLLKADCQTIVCSEGFADEGNIWMTDIPLDKLANGDFTDGQIIHLQLLWKPVAGKTPLSSSSTNLAIKHIIVSGGSVGVYTGGGFCIPNGSPKKGMSLYIEEATIALNEHNSSFVDLLTPATMTGRVSSTPNRQIARQIENAAAYIAP